MQTYRRKSNFVKASLWGVALLYAGACAGQPLSGSALPRFSVTPFAGYSFGGEFRDTAGVRTVELDDAAHYGLIANFRESANTEFEVFYSRQQSEANLSGSPAAPPGSPPGPLSVDLDVQYLQIGGTHVGGGDRARPFLAATVGGTRFDPSPLTFDAANFFSFSVGAGYRIHPSERLGLRLEGRFLGTLLRSDTDLFCQTGPDENVCVISTDSDVFWQFQTSLGVVFRF